MSERVVTLTLKLNADQPDQEVKGLKSVFAQMDSESEKSIHNVQRTLDAINTSEVQSAIKQINDGSLPKAAKDAEVLNTVIKNIDDSEIKQVAETTKQLGADAERTAGIYRDASGRMRDANGKFVASANEAKQATRGLGNEVDKTSKEFNKLKDSQKNIEGLASGFKNVGQQLLLGVTLPLAGLGLAIAKSGSEYESALNSFQVNTKATAEEMKQAAEESMQLGADLTLPATSAKNAALAMNELGKAGLTASQSMQAAKGVLQLAAAAQIDEAKAAQINGTALNAFHLEASESVRVSDLLAAASSAATGEITDMAEAMQQSATSAHSAKIPIEDLITAISLMAKNGIPGSDAGTSLKTFLASIQAPTSGAKKALEGLHISVFDLNHQLKPLPEIIGLFEKALSKLNDEAKVNAIQKIFGSDASRAAQILFSEGSAGFEKMKTAVTQAGAAADLASAKTKGLGGAWEGLKSQLETIGLTIFDQFKEQATGALLTVGKLLGQLSDKLSNLAKDNPEIFKIAFAIAGIAIAIPPVVIAIGWIADAVEAVIAIFNPFSLGFAAAFAVVSVAAYALYQAFDKNIGGIRETATRVFGELKTVIQPALTEVANFIKEIFGDVISWVDENLPLIVKTVQTITRNIEEFWQNHGQTIKDLVTSAWDLIKSIIKTAGAVIGDILKLAMQIINSDWEGAWDTTKDLLNKVIDGWIAIIKGAGTLIYEAVKTALEVTFAAQSFFTDKAYKFGEDIGKGFYNGLLQWVDPIGALGRLIGNKIIDSVGLGANSSSATKTGGNIGEGLQNGLLKWIDPIGTIARDFGKHVVNHVGKGAETQSPSRATFRIGQWIGEGLANGIINSTPMVLATSKKLADETIKQFKDAQKQFEDYSKLSPGQQQQISQGDDYQQGLNNLKEIIKLRNQLAINLNKPLPSTVEGSKDELKYLQDKVKAAKEYQDSVEKDLSNLEKIREQQSADAAKQIEDFNNRKQALSDAGTAESLRLQEERDLLGVTDDVEKQRIQNAYELLKLRNDLKNDGFGKEQIDEAVKIRDASQRDNLDLVKEKQQKQQQIDDAKKLGEAQKKQAEEIAKHIQEVYDKTKDFVHSTLETLTDSTQTFSEKFKSIFGGIADRMKENFLDKLSGVITTQILGFDPKKSDNPVVGEVQTSNKYLKTIADNISGNTLFSGGAAGKSGSVFDSPLINYFTGRSSSSGGSSSGNFFSQIAGLLGGGGSSSDGQVSGGLGDWLPGSGSSSGNGSIFSSIFGKDGLFGKDGFGNNVGTYNTIGAGASILGNLIGGRTGGVISGAGTGLGIGASIGSIIPGIGTGIGAAVGAGIGALVGLFTGGTRKQDEVARTQAVQATAAEFDKLIAGVQGHPPNPNPPSGALTQADQLIAQYSSAMSQLKDTKTRNIALNEITNGILASKKRLLQDSINVANADLVTEANRQTVASNFTGQFAGGVYMDSSFRAQYADFKRHNGLMPGAYTGKDYIRALIGDGEIVANPIQLERMRQAAGFDVVAHAGLPNYVPQPSAATPKFAGGVSFASPSSVSSSSSISSQPIVNVQVYVAQPDGSYTPLEIKRIAIDGVKQYVRQKGRE